MRIGQIPVRASELKFLDILGRVGFGTDRFKPRLAASGVLDRRVQLFGLLDNHVDCELSIVVGLEEMCVGGVFVKNGNERAAGVGNLAVIFCHVKPYHIVVGVIVLSNS